MSARPLPHTYELQTLGLPSPHPLHTKITTQNASHHRIRTYAAHALLLSTVYGIPLSSGIWLEYYYTSLFSLGQKPTPLLAVSAIFSIQLACLGLAVGPTAWTCHCWPKWWRLQMFLGLVLVCGSWIVLLISNDLWTVVLCHGALTGSGLGILGTVSTLVLSTHYRHNLSVSSTICVAAGFAGAAVYTSISWICLHRDMVKMAYGVTLALMSGTMLVAVFLARPHRSQIRTNFHVPNPSFKSHQALRSTLFILFVLLLVSPSLFLPPLYLPLLLTRIPTTHHATTGPVTLLTLHVSATLSATLASKFPPSRLSPPTLFTASMLISALALVPMLFTPTLYVAVPYAAAFGVGTGGVCALWVRTIESFLDDKRNGVEGFGRWVCVGMAVCGVSAGGGMVGAAAVMERWERGGEIVLGGCVGGLVLGGLVIGAGAVIKKRK